MPQPNPIPLPPANTQEPPEPSPPEDPTPMLDVHPAHHAATTWRDFFNHIATNVHGLLIAVGIEQAVEYVHRRDQVHQMEEALRAESLENRHTIADDLPALDAILASVDANIATLQRHRNAGEKDPVGLAPRPNVRLFVPIDTAWLGMRDSALIYIVPRQLSTNCGSSTT